MGWIVTYFIILTILVIIGFVITCFVISAEAAEPDEIEFWRILGIGCFITWTVAPLWPVLLISAVPALFIYGGWTLIRAAKHKTLDY